MSSSTSAGFAGSATVSDDLVAAGLAFLLTTTPFNDLLRSFLGAIDFALVLGGGGGGCPIIGVAVALTALVRAATAL